MPSSLARALTTTERDTVAALKGHNFYCYLSVTDADGSWRNVGALATGGGKKANFFNSATLSDGIDQNTLSFAAVLARNVGNYSLSPFRSNSVLNGRADGTLGVFLDIRRYWRLFACVMPVGVKPSAANYRLMAEGRIDSIDVQDEPATISIVGRGLEADLIDSYIMVKTRTYGDDAAPIDVETVIQKMIDDQLGAGNYPVFAPEYPVGFLMTKWTQDEGALMPAVLSTAALAAQVVRYRIDATDTNRLTQFTPPRNTTVPDWTVGHREWKARTVTKIDIQGVRNYLKATYPDAVIGLNTVISPAPEPSTVTVASETATFSVSPGVTLADDAIIVINDVGYKVSAYNAGAGTATLAGAPDVAGAKWYTSPSITKYGVRPMLIDLTQKNKITDELQVGAFLDAIRSDMEDPALESAIAVKGFWFIQLHDYVKLLPDGEITNEDTFGAVTAYSHTFANGMLDTVVSLRGKPSGGYRRWLSLGSGAPRTIDPPTILTYDADYWETYDPITGALTGGGVGDIGSVNDRVRSVAIEVGTDPTFATVEFIEYTDIVPPITVFAHQWAGASRGTIYYFRATPWSGPLVAGLPTGVAGVPAYARTYNDQLRPTKPQFDVLQGDVTTVTADVAALIAEPITTHGPSSVLTNPREWTDRPNAAIDKTVAGEIGLIVSAPQYPGPGGAMAVYQEITKVSGTLADGAGTTFILDIARTVAFQHVLCSAAAWVRIYPTLAALNADIARSILVDPVFGSSGDPILDCAPGLGGAALTTLFERNIVAHNQDNPRVGRFYMRVVNKSGAAASITTTVRYLPLEGDPTVVPPDVTAGGLLYRFNVGTLVATNGDRPLTIPNTGTLGGTFGNGTGYPPSAPQYQTNSFSGTHPSLRCTQIGGNTRAYYASVPFPATPTESHMFAVLKLTGDSDWFCFGPDRTRFESLQISDYHASNTERRFNHGIDPTQPFLYHSHGRAGLWEAYIGLTQKFTTATNTVGGYSQQSVAGFLAGGAFASVAEGYLAEWRFYSGALSDDDVLGIKNQMALDWGVSL